MKLMWLTEGQKNINIFIGYNLRYEESSLLSIPI